MCAKCSEMRDTKRLCAVTKEAWVLGFSSGLIFESEKNAENIGHIEQIEENIGRAKKSSCGTYPLNAQGGRWRCVGSDT